MSMKINKRMSCECNLTRNYSDDEIIKDRLDFANNR